MTSSTDKAISNYLKENYGNSVVKYANKNKLLADFGSTNLYVVRAKVADILAKQNAISAQQAAAKEKQLSNLKSEADIKYQTQIAALASPMTVTPSTEPTIQEEKPTYTPEPIASGVTSSHGTGITVTPTETLQTATALKPVSLAPPSTNTPIILQPTKTLIEPETFTDTMTISKSSSGNALSNLASNVVSRIEDTKLGQVVEKVVTPIVEKIIIPPKITGSVTATQTPQDVTTKRKEDLLQAKITGLDTSILSNDYEKQKGLDLEKEKLNMLIKNQYQGLPTTTSGLELLNPALALQGTKEKALSAYEQAVADEKAKADLQAKITGNVSSFEQFGAQVQLDKLKANDVAAYNALKVEVPEKSTWFGTPSVELAREKSDLLTTYKDETGNLSKQMNLIQLGATFASQDLNKNIDAYEKQVNVVNQKTELFNQKEKEYLQLEKTFEKFKDDYLATENQVKKYDEELQKNPTYENQVKYNNAYTQLQIKYDTVNDVYKDYSGLATELQQEATKLSQNVNTLNKFRSTLEQGQQGLSLAQTAYEDKATQINRLTGVLKSSLKNVSAADTFQQKKQEYQISKEYFQNAPVGGWLKSNNQYDKLTGMNTNQVSKLGKMLGTTAATFGKIGVGIAESARNIPEFAVVAPLREYKEDIAAGKTTFISVPGVGAVKYLAKGIYDWDDPNNPDYNWKTNVNWNAVKGAVDTALLVSAVAKPISAGAKATAQSLTPEAIKVAGKAALKTSTGKWVKGLAQGVAGSAIGTEAFLVGGYAKASKDERKFIDRGVEFQNAMQVGYNAEQQASSLKLIPVGKGYGDIGSGFFNLPGGPLIRSGVAKAFGKTPNPEIAFYDSVKEYYQGLGYSGKDLENATLAAMRMRKAGLSGEVTGTLSANVASELLGQKFLSDAGGAIIAGKGTFWKPALQIGKAGIIEGVAGELSTEVGRFEKINPKKLAAAGAFGGISAGLIGGTIAKLSGTTGGKVIETGAYFSDPYEKPGDIVAGWFEKGAKKAAQKSFARTASKVPVTTVVPGISFTATPSFSYVPSLTTTPTQTQSLSIGPGATAITSPGSITPVPLSSSQQMGLMTLKTKANVPSSIFIPTSTTTKKGRSGKQVKVPTIFDNITDVLVKKRASKEITSFINIPSYTSIPTSIKTTVTPLSNVQPLSWSNVWTPTTPTITDTVTESNTNENVNIPANVITNIYSYPIVPTKSKSALGLTGMGGLGPAWWTAGNKKGGFGWIVENKISDYAGDFLRKEQSKTTKETFQSKQLAINFNKKLKSLI